MAASSVNEIRDANFRAQDFIEQAEAKLKKSLFHKPKFPEGLELYNKAIAQLKISGDQGKCATVYQAMAKIFELECDSLLPLPFRCSAIQTSDVAASTTNPRPLRTTKKQRRVWPGTSRSGAAAGGSGSACCRQLTTAASHRMLKQSNCTKWWRAWQMTAVISQQPHRLSRLHMHSRSAARRGHHVSHLLRCCQAYEGIALIHEDANPPDLEACLKAYSTAVDLYTVQHIYTHTRTYTHCPEVIGAVSSFALHCCVFSVVESPFEGRKSV